jgi:hypothetical protein
MPEGVIAAVENMAEAEEQLIIGPGGPLFKWARGIPMEDDVEVPILQDEIVDVVTSEDAADGGADDDFDNDEIAPESSEKEEDGEEVDMEQSEQEAEEHVADEHDGHKQNEDYKLVDVVHEDEYKADEDQLASPRKTRLEWSRQWTTTRTPVPKKAPERTTADPSERENKRTSLLMP